MYKHLLVATDGSRLSGKAVTHAIALAQALKAELTAFYASPDYPMPAYADGVVYEPVLKKQYEAMATKEAGKILTANQNRGDREAPRRTSRPISLTTTTLASAFRTRNHASPSVTPRSTNSCVVIEPSAGRCRGAFRE